MAFQWMRPALLGLASFALLLLGGCGSGTIESQLHPSRVIAFGDAFTDAGQTQTDAARTGKKYTVNDGSLNWAQIVAADYGIALAPSSTTGGLDYATGNARIVNSPDAAGGGAPTIQQQIDTFLASNTLGDDDLVLINGGFSDIIAEMAAVNSGTQTTAQMQANVNQAGRDLATQVKRLVAAGGKHVVVVNAYDLGRTPWAALIGQQALLSNATIGKTTVVDGFNETLKASLADQNASTLKVLYLDTQALFDLMLNSPSSYGLTDVTSIMCTSVDPNGIGIGIATGIVNPNQELLVNSNLCTISTINTAANSGSYATALFADAVYPTPAGHAQFGSVAFSKIRSIW